MTKPIRMIVLACLFLGFGPAAVASSIYGSSQGATGPTGAIGPTGAPGPTGATGTTIQTTAIPPGFTGSTGQLVFGLDFTQGAIVPFVSDGADWFLTQDAFLPATDVIADLPSCIPLFANRLAIAGDGVSNNLLIYSCDGSSWTELGAMVLTPTGMPDGNMLVASGGFAASTTIGGNVSQVDSAGRFTITTLTGSTGPVNSTGYVTPVMSGPTGQVNTINWTEFDGSVDRPTGSQLFVVAGLTTADLPTCPIDELGPPLLFGWVFTATSIKYCSCLTGVWNCEEPIVHAIPATDNIIVGNHADGWVVQPLAPAPWKGQCTLNGGSPATCSADGFSTGCLANCFHVGSLNVVDGLYSSGMADSDGGVVCTDTALSTGLVGIHCD